ncbi:type II toxin-antitoxin system VapC family toxin [Humibacter antri]
MIVLDTNIVSALMAGESAMDAWLATVSPPDLYTTTVTRAEIRYGIARLPPGERRHGLQDRADALFDEIRDRTLPFDVRAADLYGEIVAVRESSGRPIGVLDAQIAAIARVRHASVATRNVADFDACAVPVVNAYAHAETGQG